MPKPLLSIAAFLTATLLTGCTQAAPAPSGSQPAESGVQAQAQQAATPADCTLGKEIWRAEGPPKRGGTFVRAQSDFNHMDFTKPGGNSGTGTFAQVYNSLLQTRDCFPGDSAVGPGLAKSWEVSSDGLTWTLKLRDDVKWHNKPPVNGRPFTSADVAWTIDYQKREGLQRSYWEPVTHEEPDATTVVLRLREPDADFVPKLAFYSNLMLPREVKEQIGDFRTTAIGTGAWMLKEFRASQISIVEPNPDYHENGADGKPLPYMDEVRTIPFLDYAAQVAAMRSGNIDANSFAGFRKLDFEALKSSGAKLRPWELLQGTHLGLWFGLNQKPFDDPRVRRAFALAIDRDDLEASNRGATVQSGFVPLYFKEYAWSETMMKEKFRADPDQAKRLLTEAGFDFSQEYEMRTATPTAEDAEVIQRQLDKIGVRTKVSVENATFRAVQQKEGWTLAFGLPVGALFLDLWVGSYLWTGGSDNIMKLSDPQVDTLARAQAREMDPTKRKQILDRLQDRLYEIMPYVPTVSRLYFHMLSCRTRNYPFIHPNYNPQSTVHAWIDTTGC